MTKREEQVERLTDAVAALMLAVDILLANLPGTSQLLHEREELMRAHVRLRRRAKRRGKAR